MKIDEIEIRRQILKTTIGSAVIIQTPRGTESAAEACALAFGRAKKIPMIVSIGVGEIVVRRTLTDEKPSIYPEIDALEVGESHLFPFPPPMHQRVRNAASSRNQDGKVRYACTREGDQIRVTRLPITDAEMQKCGPIEISGSTKDGGRYRLGRLHQPGARLSFDIPRSEHMSLRNLVSRYAIRHNLKVRCRVQDDGSMLVYRIDDQAPQAQPEQTPRDVA